MKTCRITYDAEGMVHAAAIGKTTHIKKNRVTVFGDTVMTLAVFTLENLETSLKKVSAKSNGTVAAQADLILWVATKN